MGYDRHHAIIVTGYDIELVRKAHAKAMEIFGPHVISDRDDSDGHLSGGHQVSGIVESTINPWFSFFVGPDGSMEMWDESNRGDEQRSLFREHLANYRCEDGGSRLDWVEVQYGDDELETKVVEDSDAPTRSLP